MSRNPRRPRTNRRLPPYGGTYPSYVRYIGEAGAHAVTAAMGAYQAEKFTWPLSKKKMAPMIVDSRPLKRRTPYPKLKQCRPKVKNSKKFIAKVQAVESSDTPTGTSTVRVNGHLLVNNQNNYQRITYNLYAGGALLRSASPGNPAIPNLFEWFTAGGLLHHASVLFNGKLNDVYEVYALNNFNNENLVLEIPYCSVTMKLYNHTMRVQELDFYQCVPKTSTDTSAITEWENALAQSASNVTAQVNTWYGAEPGQCELWTKKWAYKKKTFVLQPGGSATHFVKQGPLCYTYKNFLNVSGNWNFPKGIGMSCFFVNSTPTIIPNVAKVGAHTAKADVSDDYNAITCELISKYVIEAPQICEDAQKFDKWATNSYINNTGVVYTQQDVGSTGDTVKTVFAEEPGRGHVTIV